MKAGVSPLRISPVIHRAGWWDGLTRSLFPGSARTHPLCTTSPVPAGSPASAPGLQKGENKKGENAKGGNAKHPAPGPVLPGALGTERIALPLGRELLDEQELSARTHTAPPGGH